MPPRETRLTSFGPTPEPEPSASPASRALSVTAALQTAQAALASEPTLQDVWIRGELSNLVQHSSGHWYFRLKDERSVLDAAMFRGSNGRVKFQPEEGMEVLARGRVGVYPTRSSIQLIVDELQPVGVGPLQLAFEQLRKRLGDEGLFSDARKRPIPQHPHSIGVVTSLQGAVLRDIIRTAHRRNPSLRILVVGTRVQGEGATSEIVRGIQRLNEEGSVEVLIVGRGGGSMEDLWCFNEEPLLRAVVASRIPIISAVGHESDHTLCDLAADLRDSTPTAAAERAAPEARLLLEGITDAERRLARALADLIPSLRQDIDDAVQRAEAAVRRTLGTEKDLLGERLARLHALSPLAVLARGYAVARREGVVLRGPADAPVGSDVEIILRDGRVEAKVTKHLEDG